MIEMINRDNPNAVLPEDRKPFPLVRMQNVIALKYDSDYIVHVDSDARTSLDIQNVILNGIHFRSKFKVVRMINLIKTVWKHI